MTQHPNYILLALLHKQDARKARDLAHFTPALEKGSLLARIDLMAEMLNEAEELERNMLRRDLP